MVAVSKSQPLEAIRAAFAAGCRDFGENYVQDALPKLSAVTDLSITWHFIGHLQSNKARDVAEHFDWVHAVDRLRIAQALSRARPAALGALNVCIQVNISREATKSGVAPGEASALAREIAALPHLALRGLMGMASPTEDRARQRAEFGELRAVFEALVAEGHALDTLSMGMSQDLESALAEGATMVRVGTAIFGERQPGPGSDPDVVRQRGSGASRAHEMGSDPK